MIQNPVLLAEAKKRLKHHQEIGCRFVRSPIELVFTERFQSDIRLYQPIA